MDHSPGETYFTVSQITSLIKTMLEESFPYAAVEGEISNFRPSSTGHYYFSLKDEEAVISAVMFKGSLGRLRFQPRDGMLVRARGGISVYAKRGSYQLICEEMTEAGKGNIFIMLEERKRRLAAEGLFAEERKKPLPLLPETVVVITSPTGAALRDILRVLRRRHAGVNLVILPAPVQGDEAAGVIAGRLRTANTHKLGDVIILGRGGGSLEDLLPFSEEVVVRAVAESAIPVISAVGHEIDIALSDLAADMRAPTPSAAAEIVSASREQILSRVTDIEDMLIHTARGTAEQLRLRLAQFSMDNMERYFRASVQPVYFRLDDAKEQLLYGMREYITGYAHRLELLTGRLEAHSPLAVLRRGYAVVTDRKSGKLIRRSRDTARGKELSIRLYDSRLDAEVKEIYDHE
jgi:exodeoxyribonuclease VII large subunit